MFTVVLLIVMSMLYTTGSILLKKAADGGEPWVLGASFVIYLTGNLLYFALLTTHPLGTMAAVASLAQVLVVVTAGWLLFNETLTLVQLIGVLLALVAMALVLLPFESS